MTIFTYTKARAEFKSILDLACDEFEEVRIKRAKGENAVLVSEKEFDSMKETVHLLSSKNNRQHLQDSLQQIENGEIIELGIDEL